MSVDLRLDLGNSSTRKSRAGFEIVANFAGEDQIFFSELQHKSPDNVTQKDSRKALLVSKDGSISPEGSTSLATYENDFGKRDSLSMS